MFEHLSDRFASLFTNLGRRGHLRVSDIDQALRDIRTTLLEADVALQVARDFTNKVGERATQAQLIRSVQPGQQIVKIVHDVLVETLSGATLSDETANQDMDGGRSDGSDPLASLALQGPAPQIIILVGLQGSGKTTTTAKLGRLIQQKRRKKTLLVSLDTRRPAAQEQLELLGTQAAIATLPIIKGQMPEQIARRAMQSARLGGYDLVLLDTAGRLQIDMELMQEVQAIEAATKPCETLLVVDSMAGQDALQVAQGFSETLNLTGIVMTRIDGDARGGAALSMRAVTGKPIKFLCDGEKLDAIKPFSAERIARSILQMGDVVALVERAEATIKREEADRMAAKMKKGQFDLDDMRTQLHQLRKMGGMEGLVGMLPGAGKLRKQVQMAGFDAKLFSRQEAILSSMTGQERANPKLIHASRKRRIAQGSGTNVQEVNKLLKQFTAMSKMMKKAGRLGEQGMMRAFSSKMGGFPPMPG